MKKEYDVAVVGGGPAGCIVAAYLAKAGLSTIVFEKSEDVGGPKYGAFKKDGFHLDRHLHIPVWNIAENEGRGWWEKAAVETGADIKWESLPSNAVNLMGNTLQLPYCSCGDAVASLIKQMFPLPMPEESLKELAKVAHAGLTMPMDEVNSEKAETTLFKTWLKGITQDEFTEQIFKLLCAIVLCDAEGLERASISGAVGAVIGGFLGGRFLLARVVGDTSDAIPKAFCDVVIKHGGQILTKHQVKSVVIEEGRAKGVVVVNPEGVEETYRARYVVVTACFPDIRPLLGKNLPKELDEIINGLNGAHTTGIDVHFGLKKEVIHPHWCELLVISDAFEYEAVISVASHFEPTLAPAGKQAVDVYKIIPTSVFKSRPREDWIKDMTATLERVFPGVKGQVEWTESFVAAPSFTHELVAVRKFPLEHPKLSGLYFAGDYTMTPGLGTERAASSAIRVAQKILSLAKVKRQK